MKSKTLAWTIGMTLCAALTMPVWVAAPAQREQNKKLPRYKVIDLGTLGRWFLSILTRRNRANAYLHIL